MSLCRVKNPSSSVPFVSRLRQSTILGPMLNSSTQMTSQNVSSATRGFCRSHSDYTRQPHHTVELTSLTSSNAPYSLWQIGISCRRMPPQRKPFKGGGGQSTTPVGRGTEHSHLTDSNNGNKVKHPAPSSSVRLLQVSMGTWCMN